MALPWVLERLETYAHYEVVRKVLPPSGCLRLFGREVYVDKVLGGVGVTFCESLAGLEAWVENRCVGLLRDYRRFRQASLYRYHKIPETLSFERYDGVHSP